MFARNFPKGGRNSATHEGLHSQRRNVVQFSAFFCRFPPPQARIRRVTRKNGRDGVRTPRVSERGAAQPGDIGIDHEPKWLRQLNARGPAHFDNTINDMWTFFSARFACKGGLYGFPEWAPFKASLERLPLRFPATFRLSPLTRAKLDAR